MAPRSVFSQVLSRLCLLRPLPVFGLLAAGLHLASAAPPAGANTEPGRARAVALLLAERHALSASPSDVHFIDPPPTASRWWRPSRAWVLAQPPDGKNDVLLVHVRQAPEGGVLGLPQVFNLTNTFAADERDLLVRGGTAAWLVGDDKQSYSVKLADATRGQAVDPSFDRRQRWQMKGTWLQRTGQLKGVQQRSFRLDPPARFTRLEARPNSIALFTEHTRDAAIEIPPEGPVTRGAHWLQETPIAVARPGNLVTWAVDRVRSSSWFGDEQMQVLKAVAYKIWDLKDRALGGALALDDVESARESAKEVAQDLGQSMKPAAQDAEANWPPPPLQPMLDPAFEGEGQWLSLEKDPFVRKPRQGGSPFLTTFIRTDKERKFSRIMVTVWDPSVVELHMMSGTEEPKSATGETGSGLIPRNPDVLRRVVGAFNGGFQATHGSFGMQVDGTLYVPPRPFAATIARLQDGSVGFGTWPGPSTPGTTSSSSTDAVPAWINSFRQNLTPLIQDGKLNPYGRVWWGGVPQGWEDDTRTVRSGICLTKHGLLAYFYGSKVDHRHLAKAMLLANCDYALHLDMNQGHTGLEFYHIAPAQELPPLGMPLSSMWQAEGPLDGIDGYRFRGRRLFRSMQLMNFPRYVQREARDFFYLTLRRSLPSERLTIAGGEPLEDEGVWTPLGTGTPAAAKTWLRPDPKRPAAKLYLLQLDASRLVTSGEKPLIQLSQSSPTAPNLSHACLLEGRFRVGPDAPDGCTKLLTGSAQPPNETQAAFGIGAPDGLLYYAEVATGGLPAQDAELLRAALRTEKVTHIVYMEQKAGIGLPTAGGLVNLSGHPREPSPTDLSLFRGDTQRFRRIFKDTPIVERSVWKPLQRSKD